MDHGYGGHLYGTGPQQFPLPPQSMHIPQQFLQGGAPPPFFPGPPAAAMAGFPPYGPSMPYPPAAGPFAPPPPAPLQQQMPMPVSFFNPWEPPPPMVPPPPDPELQKRIEKLVEYAAKNGPEFEKMLKEKQRDNPLYAFLFGAEGFAYYRYKLWVTVNPHLGGPFMPPPSVPAISAANPSFNHGLASGLGPVNPVLNPLNTSTHSVLPPFLDQPHSIGQPHHHLPYFEPSYQEHVAKSFKGLSGPLPVDVAMELQGVLENLTGTKESIKGAKNWFMQRLPFAPALAEALRDRVLTLDDDIRQLHVIYLANDILFDSLQRRIIIKELDNEALAFQPVLGAMLAAIYFNPKNKEANQTRLQRILQFWGSKEVYNKEIITTLENEMMAGPPASHRSQGMHSTPQQDKLVPMPSTLAGAASLPDSENKAEQQFHVLSPEHPQSFQSPSRKETSPSSTALAPSAYGGITAVPFSVAPPAPVDPSASIFPALNSSFLSNVSSSTAAVTTLATNQLPATATARAADHPPYPLFPPGLIPGMIRKMQIGTGVPYSALSPLDIPAVIPPSTCSDSYISSRVAKFFKDIGEADPLEGQLKRGASSVDDDEGDEDQDRGRTGGACIPPPANLNVDLETNTLPDGSIEHKPGSISTGRLGLGAVADPNEITQYDDVYTSYRKQRSTSYHTFMSARAAAR